MKDMSLLRVFWTLSHQSRYITNTLKHSLANHRRTTLCLAHECLVIVHHTLPPHTPPQPPTLGSRIEEYLLAPSRVKETEVVDVACYLFGEAFASPSEVKRSVQEHFLPAAVDSQHSAAEDHVYHLVLADTFAWTHNLSEEEPPGYLPLGLLVVFFGKMLSTALHNTYKCHPQRSVARNDNPGQNPTPHPTPLQIPTSSYTGFKISSISKSHCHPGQDGVGSVRLGRLR